MTVDLTFEELLGTVDWLEEVIDGTVERVLLEITVDWVVEELIEGTVKWLEELTDGTVE